MINMPGTVPFLTCFARFALRTLVASLAFNAAPAIGQTTPDCTFPSPVGQPPPKPDQLDPEWWPLFGAATDATGLCDGDGHIIHVTTDDDGDSVHEEYRWVSGHQYGITGAWYNQYRESREADGADADPAYVGAWDRLSQPTGSALNINTLWAPSPGDFLNPAPTIGKSSYALLPPMERHTETAFNGVSRPVLEGVVDLVTGAPLIQVTDLVLPFGGAEFRLTRTRSAPALTNQARGEFLDGTLFPSSLYNSLTPSPASDRWWDWGGLGWMASENPLLIVDSALPDVVGNSPRTCWFIPDALHSVPFQFIESNGTYEAPPRFRARLTHDGNWDSNARSWTQLPDQYKVSLYEGRITYWFAVIREDVPENAYDLDAAMIGDPDNSNCVSGSMHDRPFLPQQFNQAFPNGDIRNNWNPLDTRYNPGIGMPHYGLCTRIEDQYGHRIEINYCDVPSRILAEDADDAADCDECWENSQFKGQISNIKLTAPSTAGTGRDTLWTLIYVHRRFRGEGRELMRPDFHDRVNAVSNTRILDDLTSLLDTVPGETLVDDYPESSNPDLYTMRGSTAIDRIYVYEGEKSIPAGTSLTIDHLDTPALDGGLDPLASLTLGNGSPIPTDWIYTVRHHFEHEETGDTLDVPLTVKTTVETADVGVSLRRSYHYRRGDGDDDHQKIVASDYSLAWLELIFEGEDISRVESELGISINELSRWRIDETDSEPFDSDNNIDAEQVRQYASLRLNSNPVDEDNDRWTGTWPRDESDDGSWAKPGLGDLWNSVTPGGAYLWNRRQDVIAGTPICPDGGNLYTDGDPSVAMLTVRRTDGTLGNYAFHKMLQVPTTYDDSAVSGWTSTQWRNYFFNSGGNMASMSAHPYRWASWDTGYSGIFSALEGQELDAAFFEPGNLARARWITIIDAFDSRNPTGSSGRDLMVDSTSSYTWNTAGAESTRRYAHKQGLVSRRTVQMNPAGYLLKEKIWRFNGDGTIDTEASGLGEEFIYAQAKDYPFDLGDQGLLDPSGAPDPGTGVLRDDIGWQSERELAQSSMLLIEHRSVGWSAALIAGDELTEGRTDFYDYEVYGSSSTPWTERIQREAEGIKRGAAYNWFYGASNPTLARSTTGDAALYSRQFFRGDAAVPSDVTTEVEFLTPATSLWTLEPTIGTAPTEAYAYAIKTGERVYQTPGDDESGMRSHKIVGPARQARPGGPFLFPVEFEHYDDCGNAIWSFSGLVEDPDQPVTGSSGNALDEYLSATFYKRNSFGVASHTVLDAEYDAVVDLEDGADIDGDTTLHINTPYPTGWGRIAASGQTALNHVTSYRYDPTTRQLTDVFFPNGRRWARRMIKWTEDVTVDGDGDTIPDDDDMDTIPDTVEEFFLREYVFNELEFTGNYGPDPDGAGPDPAPKLYRSITEGEVNDLPRGSLESWSQPDKRRTVEYKLTRDATLEEFPLDFDQATAPEFGSYFEVNFLPDANGRITQAELLEPDDSVDATITTVGVKEVNDLGEVYRERDPDGTTTRLTRNPLGFPLRTYVGTNDISWPGNPVSDPDFDMVLLERVEYGSSPNDAWQPTVLRRYRSQPSFWDDFYVTPASDAEGYATVMTYDWRGRVVKSVSYDKGDPSANPDVLNTTLTYYDHADRPSLVARFGEGNVTVAASADPGEIGVAAAANLLDELYAAGNLTSLTQTFYNSNGHPYRTHDYDTTWDTLGSDAPFLASYSYAGRNQTVVYSQSPSAPAIRTVMDGVGRIASEITADPDDTDYELTRTDYTYDAAGNVTETRRFVRTEYDSTDILTATGASPNAVRTRAVSWYDNRKRTIAEAELGTEATTWIANSEDYSRDADAPFWDESTHTVDRQALPLDARLWITVYDDDSDRVEFSIDPAGSVTQYVYSNAGRLRTKIENAQAASDEVKRETTYSYDLGRLVDIVSPRRPGADTDEYDATTRVLFGAPVLDESFVQKSRHNGLIGYVFLRDTETWPPAPHPLDGTPNLTADIELAYTFQGLVARRLDRRGLGFHYEYDGLGRLSAIKVVHRNGSGTITEGYPSSFWPTGAAVSALVEHVAFEYDDFGFLELITTYDGVGGQILTQNKRSTNARGDLLEEWSELDQAVSEMSSPSISYGWDYQQTDLSASPAEPGHLRLDSMTYDGSAPRTITLDYGTDGQRDDLISRVVAASSVVNAGTPVELIGFDLAGDGRRMSEDRADGEISLTRNAQVGVSWLDTFGAPAQLRYRNSGNAILYRGKHLYDVRGNLWTTELRQADVGSSSRDNIRSSIYSYDALNRLTTSQVGELQIVYASPPGEDPYPTETSIVSGTLVRSDYWSMDAHGNWVGTETPADFDGDDRVTIDDIAFFGRALNAAGPPLQDTSDTATRDLDLDGDVDADDQDIYDLADYDDDDLVTVDPDQILFAQHYVAATYDQHGRRSFGNLDGYGESWAMPNADSADDLHERTINVAATNAIIDSILYDNDSSYTGTPHVEHEQDAAGNLQFDGTYHYIYDAWNRLVQVNTATWNTSTEQADITTLARRYDYDGKGRLVRTTSPHPAGGNVVETFLYDGVRRIQEYIDRPDDTAGPFLDREYVWGATGDTDELIAEFDDTGKAWYPIQDAAGDVVALCDLDGASGEARVVGQWTYDAYGEVLTAEVLHAHPTRHLGHKGLFFDRLDEPLYDSYGATTETPRLIPFANALYQNRNRVYVPTYGRFLQRDPNQTAMALLESARHGRGSGAMSLAFSLDGMYGDGFNLYQYMQSNPLLRRDPMGLSSDPFDIVDDYLAETAANRAAFLTSVGQGSKAAAIITAQIASWLPIPGLNIAGELALAALGEQSLDQAIAYSALGIVPGGKLAGKLGKFVGKLGGSLWKGMKYYGGKALAALSRWASSAGRSVFDALHKRLDDAADFVRRKPAGACGCFTAATLVWTPAGAVAIAELQQDQAVFAAPEDGQPADLAQAQIGATIVVGQAALVHLTLRHADGGLETIHTTDEHPFHIADTGEWARVDRLAPGDRLSTISGEAEVVALEYGRERVPVYNLSIPGSPTYFVGEHGVWVHNCLGLRGIRLFGNLGEKLAGGNRARLQRAFRGTGLTPSGHFMDRLTDHRLRQSGLTTLSDVQSLLRNGRQILQPARDNTIKITNGSHYVVINPRTKTLITISPD